MSEITNIFARQINPGVILSQKLNVDLFNYQKYSLEKLELEAEIRRIRQQQDSMEDNLAEALAEDEFQRCLNGLPPLPSEDDILMIFKQHVGPFLDKLAVNHDRKVHLELDMGKLKSTIDKGIVAANTAAEATSSTT